MSDSNAGKKQIGKDAQAALRGWLEQAKKAGYIKQFYEKFRNGYPNYDAKQFYAPFLVEFKDGNKWILYSTTSLRDRVKETQWDAENIKKIDSTITKAYLVYPNGRPKKDRDSFVNFNKKIEGDSIYTSLDGAIPLATFMALIVKIGTDGKSKGFITCAKGNAFEERVAQSLKSEANLRVLKGNLEDSITSDVELLAKIFEKLGLDPTQIDSIDATSSKEVIGFLPCGGQPKTDVLANVHYVSGNTEVLTISCKNTGDNKVTVGQHKADDIASAIDPLNSRLKELLNKFQINGRLSDMTPTETEELKKELAPIMKTFCRFVIGGIKGPGDPVKQWAKYVMICRDDPDDFTFYTLDEYIDVLLSEPSENFGTPFSWTFASGERGNSIQFKAKVKG